MDKHKKVITLLPYKLKSNLEISDILQFLHRRKQRMFWFLIAAIVYSICVLIWLIFSGYEKYFSYILFLTSLFNVGAFYSNYKQVNLTDSEIETAVDLYREKKLDKSV